MRVALEAAKKVEEFMAIFDGRPGPREVFIPAIKSLEEETFLRNLNFFPYLFEKEEAKERLKAIGKDWKTRIEKKEGKLAWEHTLYLIHLCPRLLDLPEFRWLKEKFYGILMMRLCSSNHDKSYWEALERVRKDFSPGKSKTPEKKHVVARKFEYYRNLSARREIHKACKELLEICNYIGRDEDTKWAQLLRRIKIPRTIAERELERLKKICNEEIKAEEDYLMLPLIIQNDIIRTSDEKERVEAEKFWLKIWKPISKRANQLTPAVIETIAKEMRLSKETIRKLLKQAYREITGLKL